MVLSLAQNDPSPRLTRAGEGSTDWMRAQATVDRTKAAHSSCWNLGMSFMNTASPLVCNAHSVHNKVVKMAWGESV